MNGYNSTSSGTTRDQRAAKAPTATGRKSDSDRAPSGNPEPHRPQEYGGRKDGLEPTRYGDWEKDGRCIDF
ncbi:MAG: DUF1674 domain-containing protein [Xanthomonadales bacterium]|nr:DUF1674 domain-containing protein [Xanthomonadales bacterium]